MPSRAVLSAPLRPRSPASAMAVAALAAALLAGPAAAEPLSTETRIVDGQPMKVYINQGTRDYRQQVQVRGGRLTSRHRSARPQVWIDLPPGTAEARGPVPSQYAFSRFDDGQRAPRWVRVDGWGVDAGGRRVRQVRTVDLNALILRHARAFDLDPLLVELVIEQESGFNPMACSPAGAQGLMQLMPGTAAGLGVYDPFDPDQNIRGGAQYLAGQLRRFGSLPLALAAYNAGPGAVLEYGGVPPYQETQRYVSALCGAYRDLAARRRRPRVGG